MIGITFESCDNRVRVESGEKNRHLHLLALSPSWRAIVSLSPLEIKANIGT